MPYYYVETMQGCGIRSAANIQQARKSALAESGSSNFKLIRKATKNDVEWVRAMGGYIPETSRLTKRATDGGWWCACGWPNHDDETECSRPSCSRPRR